MIGNRLRSIVSCRGASRNASAVRSAVLGGMVPEPKRAGNAVWTSDSTSDRRLRSGFAMR